MTFEVTYNVTFRGASTIVSVGEDKSGFINPKTEVAPYIGNVSVMNIGHLAELIKPGTVSNFSFKIGAPGSGEATYLDSGFRPLSGQKAAYGMALQVFNPAST